MTTKYSPKRIDLDAGTEERIAAIVDRLKGPMRELVELQRKLGTDRERSTALQRLAETLLDSGDPAGALQVYRDREHVCRTMRDLNALGARSARGRQRDRNQPRSCPVVELLLDAHDGRAGGAALLQRAVRALEAGIDDLRAEDVVPVADGHRYRQG